MSTSNRVNRRDFLKLAAAGLAGFALPSGSHLPDGLALPDTLITPDSAGWQRLARRAALPEFPQAERLGRVLGMVEVKAKPDDASPTVAQLLDDTIVVWGSELVGSRPLWFTQRYLETPEGYIYAPNVQPVWNQPNAPLAALPSEAGVWVEVTVPFVDIILANPPARSPWLGHTTTPRLYYSQILWADQIKSDEAGQVWYRVSDRYGGFGDYFWAAAEAFRPLSVDELSPIHPEVQNKEVRVDVTYQTLSCFEGDQEVYFCRVSTGPKIDSASASGGEWATPPGRHTIWRKLVSVHMTGGTTGGGYDLPGIGWTTLFASKGMAIHSTFWHNNYGIPQSHGCVNCAPDDAKWIFRWTLPDVPVDTGDITVSGQGSTKVLVFES